MGGLFTQIHICGIIKNHSKGSRLYLLIGRVGMLGYIAITVIL